MFRRSWGSVVTIGLTASAALLMGAALIFSANSRHTEYQKTSHQYAQQYADDAATEFKRCIALPVAERAVCQSDAEETARAGQRSEYDLEAQRVTATWTQHMGIAAMIGMAGSIIGVGLIWTTFRETQRTAQIAQQNLDAFHDAERGHLVVGMRGGNKSKTSNVIRYSLTLENIGRSPVKLIRIEGGSLTEAKMPDELKGATHLEMTLVTGQELRDGIEFLGLDNIKRFPYIGGRAIYRCNFGKLHETYFCFEVIEPRDTEGRIAIFYYNVRECKRERDWPADS